MLVVRYLSPLIVIMELVVSIAIQKGALLAENLWLFALAAEANKLILIDHMRASIADS